MLEARGIAVGAVHRVDLRCGVGLHAVVTAPSAAADLVAVCAGTERPRRGVVRLEGKDPHRTPELRRVIGTLLASEEPVDGRSVRESLGRALALHGSPQTADDVLSPHGLSLLSSRAPGALSRPEQRAVALALALALDPVALLALHEPFATALPRALVAKALAERSRACIVLVVTASLRAARSLGGRVLVLGSGGLTPWDSLAASAPAELTASVEEPRKVVEALAADPAAGGLRWEARGATVVVSGPDAEAASLALMRAVQAAGVEITELSRRPPAGAGNGAAPGRPAALVQGGKA